MHKQQAKKVVTKLLRGKTRIEFIAKREKQKTGQEFYFGKEKLKMTSVGRSVWVLLRLMPHSI